MAIIYNTELHGRTEIMDGSFDIHGDSVKWKMDASRSDGNLRLIAYDKETDKLIRSIVVSAETGQIESATNSYTGIIEIELTDGIESSEIKLFALQELKDLFKVYDDQKSHFSAIFTNPNISTYDAVFLGSYWNEDTLYGHLSKPVTGTITINFMLFYSDGSTNYAAKTMMGSVGVELQQESSSIQITTLEELNKHFNVMCEKEHYSAIFTNADITSAEITHIGSYWDENENLYAYFSKAMTGTVTVNYMIFVVP